MIVNTDIGHLDPGDHFYFPNDRDKTIWTVHNEKRKAANGPAVFFYCEDPDGKTIDFNGNRSVVFLPAEELASFTSQSTNNMFSHKEASIKVFQTDDYSVFKMINGNRLLNERKINSIIKEIKNGNDMLCYYPIQVKPNDDRLDILDGQHRFFISKKLKRPVYYILVEEEKSMPDIAKINSNVEKWKPADFINCYIQHGNKNYELIQHIQDNYGFSLSVILLLLAYGNPGNEGSSVGISEQFKNGTFKALKYDEAVEFSNECMLFNSFANWRSRPFVISLYRIKKANLISIPDLLAAYNKRPEMLTEQANYKAYVNTLEQIVNVGKQKRIVIM